MLTAVGTEFIKLRRAKVTWFTFAALSLGPLGLALLMWIVREPGRASQLGLIGAKADLSGLEATWPAYAEALTLIVGVGGMLILSFVVAYVFGREYQEATAKNMLALPIGRHWFVIAKLVVALAWWIALVAAVLTEAFLVGFLIRLPGFSAGVMVHGLASSLVAAGIAFLVVPVIAWIAIWGRGYMAPIAFAFAMMALGNLFGRTGWAPWFPWSVIPLMVGMVGNRVAHLPAGSYIVVLLTFFGGTAAAIVHLRYADNTE